MYYKHALLVLYYNKYLNGVDRKYLGNEMN